MQELKKTIKELEEIINKKMALLSKKAKEVKPLLQETEKKYQEMSKIYQELKPVDSLVRAQHPTLCDLFDELDKIHERNIRKTTLKEMQDGK